MLVPGLQEQPKKELGIYDPEDDGTNGNFVQLPEEPPSLLLPVVSTVRRNFSLAHTVATVWFYVVLQCEPCR